LLDVKKQQFTIDLMKQQFPLQPLDLMKQHFAYALLNHCHLFPQFPSPSHYKLQPQQKNNQYIVIVNSNKLNHKYPKKIKKLFATIAFFTSKPS